MIKQLKQVKRKIVTFFQTPQEKRHALVGPAKLWKMKQDFQINFLKSQGLQPNQKLMDVGCGTLRGGIPLINYLEKGNYYGIEVRNTVLEEGRKELKEHDLERKEPHLIAFSEFNEISLNAKLDVMLAFSVLIHMEDTIVEKCIEFVSKQLENNGTFYANVNLVSHQDSNWQGFPVVFRTLEFYEALASKNNLKVTTIGSLGELGHISGQELGDKQVMLAFKKA
ncbi:MAG: class I SAM-dependent methyltransferase [Flavobacteriales bacterium]|jgi:cyclopropane fatty-acyl-phospholipid synthase-like methyltransferase|nr:class I SAM-dependent methyltransferase [Flavobacteriales bacterium]